MGPGIYTIVLKLDRPIEIPVGSLGVIYFRQGYYAYTGSARGPGGLKRVERHLDVLCGRKSCRRWHIDYILPHTSLVEVVATRTAMDLECEIARAIGEDLAVVRGFGSTDCGCIGHLHHSPGLDEIIDVVRAAHRTRGGTPWQDSGFSAMDHR